MENSRNSVQPRKNCNKQSIFSSSFKQLLSGKQSHEFLAWSECGGHLLCYIAGVDVEWPLMKVIIYLLYLLFVAITCGKVSVLLWKSLENSEFFSPTLWTPCNITVQHSSADTVVRAMNASNGNAVFRGMPAPRPLDQFSKNWHSWLRRRPHPTCKFWGHSVQRGRVCACVKLSPSGVYFFSFLKFNAHCYRSALSTDRRQMTRPRCHHVLFMVSLIRKIFFPIFLPKNMIKCITPYGNFEQL